MNRISKAFLLAIVVSLAIALIAVYKSPYAIQAPQIQANQQTERSLQNKSGGNREVDNRPEIKSSFPTARAEISKIESTPEAKEHPEDGTEFWPPLFGFRLKITDTLIAGFTALLFWATWLLWRATRRLVLGADRTAKNQLRAFVFIKGIDQAANYFTDANSQQYVKEYVFWASIENVGLTPATDVKLWINNQILPMIENPEPNFSLNDRGGSSVILGPRGMGQTAYSVVPTKEMIALWENRSEIYLRVRLEYRDIFDPDIVHHHEQVSILGLLRHPSDVEPPHSRNIPRVTLRAYGPNNTIS